MSLEGPASGSHRRVDEPVGSLAIGGNQMVVQISAPAVAARVPVSHTREGNAEEAHGAQVDVHGSASLAANSHAANGHGANSHGANGQKTNGHGAHDLAGERRNGLADATAREPAKPLPTALVLAAAVASAPAPATAKPVADVAAATRANAVAPTPSPAAAELVRSVVAEKTGYPPDMLELGMDLETELGINSIKQVEILSTLRERMPGMPEIEPARLAELRTLGAIAAAIGGNVGAAVHAATAPVVVVGHSAAAKQDESHKAIAIPVNAHGTATTPSSVAAELVRAVVAEKTGYPPDMLELGMDLETELGINSIKQVEILSTLRERMPGMPEIEPARLAELRTLGAIASAIGGGVALGK